MANISASDTLGTSVGKRAASTGLPPDDAAATSGRNGATNDEDAVYNEQSI